MLTSFLGSSVVSQLVVDFAPFPALQTFHYLGALEGGVGSHRVLPRRSKRNPCPWKNLMSVGNFLISYLGLERLPLSYKGYIASIHYKLIL